MSRARDYLIAAAVVVALLLSLAWALRSDPGRRNWEIFTEMAYSQAAESNTLQASLPGGLSQQALVPGVVPRGAALAVFGPGPEEALRAGAELQQPLDVDDVAVQQRGRELYGIYCSVCHDAAGDGRGPAVLRGVLPPPSLQAERARAMPDGQMFHVLSFGQGAMASYAPELGERERWAVVRHVRALQDRSKP